MKDTIFKLMAAGPKKVKYAAGIILISIILIIIFLITRYMVHYMETQNKRMEDKLKSLSGVNETITMLNEKKQMEQYKKALVNQISKSNPCWAVILPDILDVSPMSITIDNVICSGSNMTVECTSKDMESMIDYIEGFEKSKWLSSIRVGNIYPIGYQEKLKFTLLLIVQNQEVGSSADSDKP